MGSRMVLLLYSMEAKTTQTCPTGHWVWRKQSQRSLETLMPMRSPRTISWRPSRGIPPILPHGWNRPRMRSLWLAASWGLSTSGNALRLLSRLRRPTRRTVMYGLSPTAIHSGRSSRLLGLRSSEKAEGDFVEYSTLTIPGRRTSSSSPWLPVVVSGSHARSTWHTLRATTSRYVFRDKLELWRGSSMASFITKGKPLRLERSRVRTRSNNPVVD